MFLLLLIVSPWRGVGGPGEPDLRPLLAVFEVSGRPPREFAPSIETECQNETATQTRPLRFYMANVFLRSPVIMMNLLFTLHSIFLLGCNRYNRVKPAFAIFNPAVLLVCTIHIHTYTRGSQKRGAKKRRTKKKIVDHRTERRAAERTAHFSRILEKETASSRRLKRRGTMPRLCAV